MIAKGEVADLIRRNCLAFKPTDRDRADLRALGADAEVLGSMGGCGGGGRPPAPAPAAPPAPVVAAPPAPAFLSATPLESRVVVTAGTQTTVRVQARRGFIPQAGATLLLRGSSRIKGGPARDAEAVTDDSGVATFRFPAGTPAATYWLEVVTVPGGPLPGRPAVQLAVRAAAPATGEVRPRAVDLDSAARSPVAVVVAVKDQFGNSVTNEAVELRPEDGSMGVAADTQRTDSVGRATFLLRASTARRSGRVAFFARGQALGSLDAAATPAPVGKAPALSDQIITFVDGTGQRGPPRTRLGDRLALQLRTRSGRPIAGKTVFFSAVNAQLVADSAVTDSAGHAAVAVILGMKAGNAVITAAVDSVRTQATLRVEPGSAVELVLERDGLRVDGGSVLVDFGVPFALTLKARDSYGNLVPTASLTGRLQELRSSYNSRQDRVLDLLGVQPQALATVLTFKPVRVGTTEMLISVGLTAKVSVEVVR